MLSCGIARIVALYALLHCARLNCCRLCIVVCVLCIVRVCVYCEAGVSAALYRTRTVLYRNVFCTFSFGFVLNDILSVNFPFLV